MATLRKVHMMASDKKKLFDSAEKKLKEFLHLDYPIGMLWKACSRIAREECEGAWISIRKEIPSWVFKKKNSLNNELSAPTHKIRYKNISSREEA